ncbi:MAG: hypothetical protein V7K47_10970 [Nostoc sp.]
MEDLAIGCSVLPYPTEAIDALRDQRFGQVKSEILLQHFILRSTPTGIKGLDSPATLYSRNFNAKSSVIGRKRSRYVFRL